MSPVAIQTPQAVLSEYAHHEHQEFSLIRSSSSSHHNHHHQQCSSSSSSSSFSTLITSIRDTIGPNPDLKFDDVDVDKLQSLMRGYKSSRSEWERFSFIDFSRNYTRNLVDNLHGNANLILMTWTPNKASLIHDHTSAHCVMRILQGHIIETKYEWPTPGVEEPLKIKEVRHYYAGDVAYINDDV
ncbi:hypothetical protein AA313_de0202445 [Arthrobotrys entomopaga]|nr:hypothetical protein AA313_de0202445 [Arthrobotrys entomopaga]